MKEQLKSIMIFGQKQCKNPLLQAKKYCFNMFFRNLRDRLEKVSENREY